MQFFVVAGDDDGDGVHLTYNVVAGAFSETKFEAVTLAGPDGQTWRFSGFGIEVGDDFLIEIRAVDDGDPALTAEVRVSGTACRFVGWDCPLIAS